MRDRRVAAASRFASTDLPTTADEVWRYSRIDDLDLDRYRLADPGASSTSRADPAQLDIEEWTAGGVAATVVVVDGKVTSVEVSAAAAASGLTVSSLLDGTAADGPGAGALTDDSEGFIALNEAFAADPIVVRSTASSVIDGVVHVVRISTVDALATFGRLIVHAGANSTLAVVEHHRSTAQHTFTAPYTELRLDRDARLRFLGVNDLAPTAWQLGTLTARVDQGAELTASSAGFGGDYVRLRTNCRLIGRGASGNLLAIFFGDDDQMLDYRTFQDHRAPDTTSDLLFNGAVGGRSRSVYTGLIRVEREARNTNAMQTNHNLKLSEEAWAESVPNLEIETKDVRCTHASSVGPIDADQRFYLESRGVRPADAERLILTGYFEEVIDRIDVPGVAEPLRRRVRDKVETGFAASAVTA